MHRWRIFYRDNKQKVWKIGGIVIFAILIIHIANYIVSRQNDNPTVNNYSNTNNIAEYMPSESIDSGSKISDKATIQNIDLIEKFINSCNDGNVEEAYNLLSEDCKKELYPSIDIFEQNYYQTVFNSKKSYDADVWSSALGNVTYRMKIMDDIMSSGQVSNQYVEDYYTVISQDDEKKLNIGDFVAKENVNEKEESENLIFEVINKYMYMDYEKFEIRITNNTDTNVFIDTKEDTDTVYLEDTNGVEYDWYGHEIDNKLLELAPNSTITLNIKFNKMYNESREDKSINFTNILIGDEQKSIEIDL